MIKGIGIDIVEIKRVETLLKTYGDKFTERNFSQKEIDYCQSKPRPAQHYAGRFAAKEAFIKAFGKPLVLKEIEVENKSQQPPSIKLTGTAKNAFTEKNILLSISHDHEYAIAQVILQ